MSAEADPAGRVGASLGVLLAGQQPGGGYVACPTYPTYRYVWLRDGAFCAYALGLHGAHGSAAAFHEFVTRALLRYQALFEAVTASGADGMPVAQMPPARFTLTGHLEADQSQGGGQPVDAGNPIDNAQAPWPNFQLDGYGIWVWALAQHVRHGYPLTTEQQQAVALVSGYLQVAGAWNCYDCWEEYPRWRHTSTVGAVIAGLAAAADLIGDAAAGTHAQHLRELLLDEHVRAGTFVKHTGTDGVDASLLWLATPFTVMSADDPIMRRTVARIIDELTGPSGGLRRYLGDTFYGGGEWVLLTAWLGTHLAAIGDLTGARQRLAWVESKFTAEGHLPEQITEHPQAPDMVAPWVMRWGPVATPLLWSHAMHLVLLRSLREGSAPGER
ncbi:MAG: glycoside hydrolase family 15 protein [Actinobacteria bacterium]|nr:glycoside hydrolase family 15 protein [Actinomycetota bacterium]